MSSTKIILAKGDVCDKVYLSESEIDGVGLFAKENIPKGFIIHATHYYHEKHQQWVNITPNYKYNHSKLRANCEILTQEKPAAKALSSLREINKGEELLVDYTQDNILEQPEDSWENC